MQDPIELPDGQLSTGGELLSRLLVQHLLETTPATQVLRVALESNGCGAWYDYLVVVAEDDFDEWVTLYMGETLNRSNLNTVGLRNSILTFLGIDHEDDGGTRAFAESIHYLSDDCGTPDDPNYVPWSLFDEYVHDPMAPNFLVVPPNWREDAVIAMIAGLKGHQALRVSRDQLDLFRTSGQVVDPDTSSWLESNDESPLEGTV